MIAPLVRRLMLRSLRTAFYQVVWMGPAPELPPGRPVIAYANHHYFHDGYLMWLLLERLVHRPGITWMADWDRFPFFAPTGALPFPPGDAGRRAETIRRTRRRLAEHPETVLVLFPEGRLHDADDGVDAFDGAALQRLAGVLAPELVWWPVAIRLVWQKSSRPVALLAGGPYHAAMDGAGRQRLEDLLERQLTGISTGDGHVLLRSAASPQERWDFRFARTLFERTLG